MKSMRHRDKETLFTHELPLFWASNQPYCSKDMNRAPAGLVNFFPWYLMFPFEYFKNERLPSMTTVQFTKPVAKEAFPDRVNM